MKPTVSPKKTSALLSAGKPAFVQKILEKVDKSAAAAEESEDDPDEMDAGEETPADNAPANFTAELAERDVTGPAEKEPPSELEISFNDSSDQSGDELMIDGLASDSEEIPAARVAAGANVGGKVENGGGEGESVADKWFDINRE